MIVEFPQAQRERMRDALLRAKRREIGGILMAEQVAVGHFRIVDFSIDDVTGGGAHFVRSLDYHRAALARFYETTGEDYTRFDYLGEWHSHPNHPPVPSSTDRAAMEDLVVRERDIPFALLIIVRAIRARRVLLSATLFQRGAPPESVTVIGAEEE